MMSLTQFLFLISFVCSSNCSEFVSLESNGSVIIGRKLYTVLDKKPFLAFWKIPYAKPPLRHLRFKPPERFQTWLNQSIYNYSHPYDETCSSKFDEDCLYLSVYVPISDKQTEKYAVIVWVYEYSNLHGPDFLIEEDVILVTVSFRTRVLGFLNTGDYFAEGNMGAKDILMALKWIKDNVSLFNGNPSKVTVLGSGKAASIVASFLLSSMARDLFTRVIIQSGSALSPADYRNYNFEITNKLYWNLNGPSEKFNRKRLYEILANASVCDLMLASQNLFDSSEVRDNQRLINSFGPTIETSKNAFMNKVPSKVYKRKMANNNVEVIIGYTSLESLYKLKGLAENKKLLKYLNYNFQYLLPFGGKSDEYGSKRYKKIKRKIMDFYFLNGTIGEQSLRRYAKYISDQVIYPILRQAMLHAEVSCSSVYLYRFSFKGSLNIGWSSSVRNLSFSGATSGDEICYLFRCKSVNDIYNSATASNERHFIRKIARLWTNFAKCGNPTPKVEDDILKDLQWKPLLSHNNLTGLSLRQKLRMVNVPEEKRLKFWDELHNEFFPDKVWHDEL